MPEYYKMLISRFKNLLEEDVAYVFGLTSGENGRKKDVNYYDQNKLFKRLLDEKLMSGDMLFVDGVTTSLSMVPRDKVDKIFAHCTYALFDSEVKGIFMGYKMMQGKDLIMINEKLCLSDDRLELIYVILHETAHYLLHHHGYYDNLIDKISNNLIGLGLDLLNTSKTEYIVREFVTDILVEKLLLDYKNHSSEETEEIEQYLDKTRKYIFDQIKEWCSEIRKEVYGNDDN